MFASDNLVTRYTDRAGRVHDHGWPDHTGRTGCHACAERLGFTPIGFGDSRGYLWCRDHAPMDDSDLRPVFNGVGPHDEEPCESCGRILNKISALDAALSAIRNG